MMESTERICCKCKKPFTPRKGKENLDKWCFNCASEYFAKTAERQDAWAQKEKDDAINAFCQRSLLDEDGDEVDPNAIVSVYVGPDQRNHLKQLAAMQHLSLSDYLEGIIKSI